MGSLAAPGAVLVHGPGTDDPLMQLTGTSQGMTTTPNAVARYFLSDGLGSVVGLVGEFSANAANSQASQRFDAWGATTQASGAIPTYGYTGREPDGTGLMHYRARSYHPALGRFTSRDPAGMVDAVTPYAYVANSPVMFTDPSGRYAVGSLGFSSGVGKGPTPNNWALSSEAATVQSLQGLAGRSESTEPIAEDVGKLAAAIVGNPSSNSVLYERTGPNGECYIGRCFSERFDQRQLEHNRSTGRDNVFRPLEVVPTREAPIREESIMRQRGGPSSQGGTLENRRYEVNELRYRQGGGTVPRPSGGGGGTGCMTIGNTRVGSGCTPNN